MFINILVLLKLSYTCGRMISSACVADPPFRNWDLEHRVNTHWILYHINGLYLCLSVILRTQMHLFANDFCYFLAEYVRKT